MKDDENHPFIMPFIKNGDKMKVFSISKSPLKIKLKNDRFVECLSKSKYRDNFILKGVFYLSNLFGIDNRRTMDIDTTIRNTVFTKQNFIKMISEIINVDIDDNVNFEIEKTELIRDEDEYGGLRITINFILENMKDSFHIDLATGDSIYRGPIDINMNH